MTLLVAKYHISSSSANISFADGAAERVDYDEKESIGTFNNVRDYCTT